MTVSSEKAKRPRAEENIQMPLLVPADWRKGALLNVRNHGEHYVITLWPEEYSAECGERCIKFTNLGECQNFVSDWYSRQTHDPRAR